MTVLREYAAALAQPALGLADAADVPAYDEVVGPDGTLRPAWKGFAELAVSLTPGDLARVHAEVGRALADDGVTYGRGGRQVPWRLDPVPWVLDAETWTPLAVGLAQRAELLGAVLTDLYGEQRLLADGVVPAAVVLGHPGFVRAVVRPSVPDPRPLLLAATDLVHDAGGWRVVADRTQAPSGLGYAMENRRVVSRVLPELYREAGLHRLEPYFWALRSALVAAAPADAPDPRVVVLTPGTHSETAYDQAFVASTLGFPLVQGSDLMVRDGHVWSRAAGGPPERVDVILRRVDAAWSDPLELRGESQLGVPGLVEAVRRGRVRVVNGLGGGVLENPALLPYLPAACEALLGEPLRLPSVETVWCGEPDGLARVLRALAEPTPGLLVRTLDGAAVTGRPDQVAQRLRDEPHRYVAQAAPRASRAPVWQRGRAVPQPVWLRTFTTRYGSAYRPLAGGLAVIGDPPGAHAGRLGRGAPGEGGSGVAKDVWVLKQAPADPDQGLTEVRPLTQLRAVPLAGPRVLDGMFWVGRYAERVEDLLRLLLATHVLAEDFRSRPGTIGGRALDVLLGALARVAGRRHPDLRDLDVEFRSLLLDVDRDGSVAQGWEALRDAASGVRDQLSPDFWRVFGVVERARAALAENPHSHQVGESAGRMLTGVLSLSGVTANMVRDPGWRFIHVGIGLERALQLVHLMRATVTVRRGLDVDRTVSVALLQASESAVTHRRRYRGYVRPANLVDLLLLDAENPRSLRWCVDEIGTHLARLPGSTGSTRPERLLADLAATLDDLDVATLVALGGVGRPYLEGFLDDVHERLTRLGEAIAEQHVASGPPPRPLGIGSLLDLPGTPPGPDGDDRGEQGERGEDREVPAS